MFLQILSWIGDALIVVALVVILLGCLAAWWVSKTWGSM